MHAPPAGIVAINRCLTVSEEGGTRGDGWERRQNFEDRVVWMGLTGFAGHSEDRRRVCNGPSVEALSGGPFWWREGVGSQ